MYQRVIDQPGARKPEQSYEAGEQHLDAPRDEYRDLTANQVGCQGRQSFRLVIRRAVVNWHRRRATL
jgi:hypothetical protein